MKALKSLTLAALPSVASDPKIARRSKLLIKLEEQRALATDSAFVRTVQKRVPNGTGGSSLEAVQKRVRPWWREDTPGTLCLTLHYGSHKLELEKGKAVIVVGGKDQLLPVLDTVITAVKAGELDEHLAQLAKLRVASTAKKTT